MWCQDREVRGGDSLLHGSPAWEPLCPRDAWLVTDTPQLVLLMWTVPCRVLALGVCFFNKFPHWKPRLQSMSLFTLAPFPLSLYHQIWESAHLHVLLPHFWLTLEPTPASVPTTQQNSSGHQWPPRCQDNWHVSLPVSGGLWATLSTVVLFLLSGRFSLGFIIPYPSFVFPLIFLYPLSWVFSSP